MNSKNPKVDAFIAKARKWREELVKLRSIVLDSELTEELKWYQPCYTFQGRNVIIVSGYKTGAVVSFLKGSLLRDPHGILIRPGAHSQAVRMARFASVQEIADKKAILKAYIAEAVGLEKAGREVPYKKITEHPIPEELQKKWGEMPALKTAFRALTPGRQRGYLLHFSGAKQSQTRAARIEKHLPRILAGKGLDD